MLAATGGTASIPAITGRLEGGNKQVRIVAAQALAEFGTAAASATDALLAMSKSRDAAVCNAATDALARIRPK